MIRGIKAILNDEVEVIENLEQELLDFVDFSNETEFTMLEDAKKPIHLTNEMERHYIILIDTLMVALNMLNKTRNEYLNSMEVYEDDNDEKKE